MACGSPARLIVPRCLVAPCCPLWRVRAVSRRISPAGAFHPGEAAIPGEVIYSAPFSSAHLIHPGSSPHPSHDSPSHPGKQAGRARRRATLGSVIVSPPRLVIATSRLSCRTGGANGISFPSAGSVSGSRFPRPHSEARHGPRIDRREAIDQRHSYRQAGRSSWSHQSARRASKQDGSGPRPVPSRLGPVPSASSAHRLIRLVPHVGQRGPIIDTAGKQAGSSRPVRPPRPSLDPSCRVRGSPPGPSVNRRQGKAKRPAPLVEERGERRRFNARGNYNRRFPSYRRRYRWPVPAPDDSSRRR